LFDRTKLNDLSESIAASHLKKEGIHQSSLNKSYVYQYLLASSSIIYLRLQKLNFQNSFCTNDINQDSHHSSNACIAWNTQFLGFQFLQAFLPKALKNAHSQ